ncbi:MAG: ornithine carbamoyltransferase [Desulfovibrionaceae bacterium]|nr:ornithine carbamoyltransferase [Desulfovibrionaceae bacterium]
MPRRITTIAGLGKDLAWTLMQQARGIPDAKSLDDYLTDRTFVVLFARPDLPERMCITAAIRQMSGHAVYMGPEEHWEEAIAKFSSAMLGSMSYYMDGVMVHGLLTPQMEKETDIDFPLLNLGGMDAHPAHALSDIMCLMRCCRDDLRTARVAWIGGPAGALMSMIAASKFFPFSMRVCLPDNTHKGPVMDFARDFKTSITFCDTPADAVAGCQFVMTGSSDRMNFDEMQRWRVTEELLAKAEPGARVMAGTNPMHCIPIDHSIVAAGRDLFLQQSENRLRVYKRMLHWLYQL